MADQPTHRLAQLSDLHLTVQNTPLAGQIAPMVVPVSAHSTLYQIDVG